MHLVAENAKCTGCGVCLTICPLAHFQANDPMKAALRIDGQDFPAPGGYRVHVCDQCGDCARACPVEALAAVSANEVASALIIFQVKRSDESSSLFLMISTDLAE